MAIAGIDLGTSNSLVSVWHGGKVDLVPGETGSFLTPSAVSIDDDGSILTGHAARERLVTAPERTATGFKRLMGTDKPCILGGRAFAPEELSSFILRRLRRDAESYLGEEVAEAVISVPAYFNDRQRAATKKAGVMAGLRVERLVNEPSAAALACRMVNHGGSFTALVFDLGGGTLDVSVVDCFENVISVLAVAGDNRLGGSDIDQCLARAYCQKNGIDFDALSANLRADILFRAEGLKKELSLRDRASLVIGRGPLAGSLEADRQRLVDICAPLFRRMGQPVRRALADCRMNAGDIGHVVLVGGSCRMPVVRQFLSQLLRREIDPPFSPDTIVGLGAGMCAGMRERRDEVRDIVMTDLCPFSLGTGVSHDGGDLRFSPIIERNTSLPSSQEKRYYTTVDDQKTVAVEVFQGEEMLCKDDLCLGEIKVPVPPAPAGEESVDVRFTYDINGILAVDVTVTSTGERFSRVFSDSGDLTEQEVSARLEELASMRMNESDALRAVREKVRRLYAQCLGKDREALSRQMERFERNCANAGLSQKTREIRRMESLLDGMERHVSGYGRLPSDFEDPPDDDGGTPLQ